MNLEQEKEIGCLFCPDKGEMYIISKPEDRISSVYGAKVLLEIWECMKCGGLYEVMYERTAIVELFRKTGNVIRKERQKPELSSSSVRRI